MSVRALIPFLLLGPVAAIAAPTDAARSIVVEGWADTPGKPLAKAREHAIADALKRAVEQVAGARIKTLIQDRSASRIEGGSERFEQEVVSKIHAETEGFVSGYEVLGERVEGAVLKVKLRVTVNDARLERELARFRDEAARARNPKLLLLIEETYVGSKKDHQRIDQPVFRAALEESFLQRGLELAKTVSPPEPAVVRDESRAAELGASLGADYVVAGEARVEHTSFDDFRQGDHHGVVELDVRMIDVGSGTVIGSAKRSGRSPPACFSEVELRTKSIRALVPSIQSEILDRLLAAWERDRARGLRYQVSVENVTSYQDQAVTLLDRLGAIDGVSEVRRLSFQDGRLTFELYFPRGRDFEAALLGAVTKTAGLAGLGLRSVQGRNLDLSFTP